MKVQCLLTAAVLALEGVSAHPTLSHGHLHALKLRDVLSKRIQYDTSNVKWDEALKNVDWDSVFGKSGKTGGSGGNSASTAPVKPASQPSPSQSSSGSSGKSSGGGPGSCLDLTKLGKRATTQQDSYMGNSQGNIHPEANCQSSGKYSLTFVNNQGSKQTYWLWNKAGTGSANAPNGMMIPASHIFDLENGQKATFTFDANSLIGFSQACGRATANGGVPNCNIGEASFADGNTAGGSNGGSFYDVSLVPVTMISQNGGNPSKIPMSLSAPGYTESSLSQCNYVQPTDNFPINAPSGGCNCGTQSSGEDFHVTAKFG